MKIRIPKEMLRVAEMEDSCDLTELVLEAAFKWLSEYGPTISKEQTEKFYAECLNEDRLKHRETSDIERARYVADRWMRSMFSVEQEPKNGAMGR